MGSEITIQGGDGGFMGYLATPATPGGAGIVVIQEIFGVNKVMRDIADGLAADGYVALCPDLFWRQDPGIQLTDQSEVEWARAFELFQGFDVPKGVNDIDATIAHLRGMSDGSAKVGAVGYCLGGLLAYLVAARTSVDCAVGYYGVGIEGMLDEAGAIKGQLMLHIAEEDQFVPPDAQVQVLEGLANNSHIAIHSYPGADHAFARIGGEHHDQEAADLANGRSRDFFRANLG
jgi:carboxymethylenebutenolidase